MFEVLKQYKAVIAGTVSVLVLILACWLTYHIIDTGWQAKWDKQQLEYKSASLKATIEARNTEQRYQNDIENIRAEGAKQVAKANADTTRASAAVDRVQQRINELLANTATEVTGTSQRGKTASSSLNLLADVLRKSIERNRQLAAFADASHNAGLVCEKSYDAVRK